MSVVCCWFLIWRWRVLDKKPPPFLSLVFLKPKRLCLWTLFVSFIDDDNVVFLYLLSDADSEDSPSSGGILKCHKTKRVRTTFTEEQLQILQANFNIDSNPDGQDLERIAQLTGLSKRVTQVWFQNSRARQKKYGTPLFSSSPRTPSAASFWFWWGEFQLI